MKKTILLVTAAALVAGTIMTACQSSAEKVENAQENVKAAEENVLAARQELTQALKESIQQFRMESEKELSANDKSIAAFKVLIARESKQNRALYEKKLADLEQQNREMKKNLKEFNAEQKDKWELFRARFKQDMDEHARAIKTFWTGKK